MPLSVGILVDMASGLLFAALAVLVWRLGPAHGPNRTFAAFAAVFAAFLVAGNLVIIMGTAGTELAQTVVVVAALLAVTTVALTVRLARYLPWPTSGADRSSLGSSRFAPASAAGVFLLLYLSGFLPDLLAPGAGAWSLPSVSAVAVVNLSAFSAVAAGLGYLAAWMPIRYTQGETGRDRHQAALLGVALPLFPVLFVSVSLGDPRTLLIGDLGAAVLVGSLAGLWLWATSGPGARRARWAAWIILGIALAGTIAGARWGVQPTADSGLMGLARAVTVLVVAYGILRYQLLGIDVTVKRGVRQSTLAAIFVAVFFVASEGAQVLFADFAGSEIVGVLAAGALVFALAPLQRFAQSVADAAVPYAAEPDEMGEDERLAVYRRQAEVAWSDGELTPDERAMLDDLRDQLGVEADAAADVESEAAEASGGEPR